MRSGVTTRLAALRTSLTTVGQILRHVYQASPGYLLMCLAKTVLEAVNPLLLLILPAALLDRLLQGASPATLALWIALSVGLPALGYGLVDLLRRHMAVAALRVSASLDLSVNLALARVRYEVLDGPQTHAALQQLQAGSRMVGPLTAVLESRLFRLVASIIRFLTIVVLLASLFLSDRVPIPATALADYGPLRELSRHSALVLLIIALLTCAGAWLRHRLQRGKQAILADFGGVQREYSYLVGLRADYENGADVRINRLGDLIRARSRRFYREEGRMMRALATQDRRAEIAVNLSLQLGTVLSYAFIALKLALSQISVGSFYLYIGAITQFRQIVFDIVENQTELALALSFYSAYPALWALGKAPAADRDPDGSRTAATEPEASERSFDIAMEGVSFAYGEDGSPVLDGLDLHIPSGEHVAIVGLNGSGKTTLVKLLLGLYRPQQGRIAVGGEPIQAFDEARRKRSFTAVFQDYAVFDATVGENVAASEDYPRERVLQ